jgi:hypothetical protein
MPKRQVEFKQGGYYHLYNRGAGRQSIFREEKNYIYLLRLLKKVRFIGQMCACHCEDAVRSNLRLHL